MTCLTCQAQLVHTPHAPSESKPYVGSFMWCLACGDWHVLTGLEPATVAFAESHDLRRIGGIGRSALMIVVLKLTSGVMANKLKGGKAVSQLQRSGDAPSSAVARGETSDSEPEQGNKEAELL